MAKNYQIQMTDIDEDGIKVPIYPINTTADVRVGKLDSGEMLLPGVNSDEILSQTLSNLKKWLSNLSIVADTLRDVVDTDGISLASDTDIPSISAFKDAQSEIKLGNEMIAQLQSDLNNYAPKAHAVDSSIYGAATSALFGHVKLTDIISKELTDAGLALSQKAGYALKTMIDARAPQSHAAATNIYGVATSALFGHVKLTDTFESEIETDRAGTALSQEGAYNMYTKLYNAILSIDGSLDGAAPISHSDASTKYGGANSSLYGHVILTDSYDATNTAVESVAVTPYALSQAIAMLKQSISSTMQVHLNTKGNASTFGHVKLSDSYATSAGSASDGVAASSYAVKLLYNTVMSAFGNYLPLSGGAISGVLQVTQLDGQGSVNKIKIGGYGSYLAASTNSIALCAKNYMGSGDDPQTLIMLQDDSGSGSCYPSINEHISLGTTTNRWSGINTKTITSDIGLLGSLSTNNISLISGSYLNIGCQLNIDNCAKFTTDSSGITLEPYDTNHYLLGKFNSVTISKFNDNNGMLTVEGNAVFSSNVSCTGSLSVTNFTIPTSYTEYTSFIANEIKLRHSSNNQVAIVSGYNSTIHADVGFMLKFTSSEANLYPCGDNNANLGTSTSQWNSIYTHNLTTSSIFYMDGPSYFRELYINDSYNDGYAKFLATDILVNNPYSNCLSLCSGYGGTRYEDIGFTIAMYEDSAYLQPITDNTVNLGLDDKRWGTIYTNALSVKGNSTFTGIPTFSNGFYMGSGTHPFCCTSVLFNYTATNVLEFIHSPSSGTGGVHFGFLGDSFELYPVNDNNSTLGRTDNRWTAVYATNGTIQTSDRKKKKDILSLDKDKMLSFVTGLSPVSYKFIDGTSGRTHYGLIAQDVETLMDSLDMTPMEFGGLCKDYPMIDTVDENGEWTSKPDTTKEPLYSLRYDEFIAPMLSVEQMLVEKVDALESENKELREKLSEFESRLSYLEEMLNK